MKNIFSKIYKAIDKGIYKSLIIDDDFEDTSVNYGRTKIKNNLDLMPYYISNIISENNVEDNYEMVCKLFNEKHITYKVRNFEELAIIFDILQSNIPHNDNINIQWINSENAVNLICDDYSKISIHQYDGTQDIQFIILKNDKCDHDIILHKDLMINSFIWGIQIMEWNNDITENNFYRKDCIYLNKYNSASYNVEYLTDYNGFEHTYQNADINKNNRIFSDKTYPALFYVHNINLPRAKAYLPSTGEMIFIKNYIDIINKILKIIGGKFLNIYDENGWWTSTEHSYNKAWCFKDFHLNTSEKKEQKNILPLFKIK